MDIIFRHRVLNREGELLWTLRLSIVLLSIDESAKVKGSSHS